VSLQSRGFRKRVVAIVEPDLAPLMRLLGVNEVFEVFSETNILNVFNEVAVVDDIGVIITQKRLIEKIPSGVLEEINSKLYPIIVAIPDNVDDLKMSPVENYRDLIRKFIGFEIHL